MPKKKGNYFDPLWSERTTIPVKRVGDRWEFFYGGDVPVKDGTMGELTISTNQISDPTFLQRVTKEATFKVLEEGTPLLVALSDRSQNGSRIGNWPTPHPLNVPAGTTRWAQVKLGPPPGEQEPSLADLIPETGGLWLKVKGLERCELASSTILLPDGFQMPVGLADRAVKSLNHAFTLLSQTYEKHRISNTGNVYTRVFYRDKDECWYPLDDLRCGVQAKKERQLLYETWAQVEMMLGWRPIVMPKRVRR
jgi:hypothetical protein